VLAVKFLSHSYSFACVQPVHLHCVPSKFGLFLASGLKDEKLIKKQTYMKTETCKLHSRVYLILLPDLINIDRYNFELYRFKVGAFLGTQCKTEKGCEDLYNI